MRANLRTRTLATLAALACFTPLRAYTSDFDYYLLTLSWSPAFCSWHPNDSTQCGNRRFAFVLHGLWPQYADGGYPRDCRRVGRVPRRVADRALAIMPSWQLIQHEWEKHGACTTLDAESYFALAEQAFGSIAVPPALEDADISRELSAADVAAAFRRANPRISDRGIAIRCRGRELEEVRICLNTRLSPVACGRGVRDACPRGPVLIRAVR